MDVSFSNVLEGTRQYFMGVPKPAGESASQAVWTAGAPPEEGAPAQSGAPTQSSRPPSAAAAPQAPPRPPSEPLEPEPHIIHKATVMREAAEKRREQPDMDDEADSEALSPPPHVVRRAGRALPSPAPAPAAPSPSPARPPSTAAPQPQPEPVLHDAPYRGHTPTARPPDPFAPTRPPDPYSASRPPEAYARYHYEPGPPAASPQPALPPRHSPQTYARLSSGMPSHSRLREPAAQSPPVAVPRYSHPPTPLNDRVPPIHHPPQRGASGDGRPAHPHREPSPYSRVSSHYDRHPAVPQKKYDPQLSYPGYRPTALVPQPMPPARVEPLQHVPYKHAVDSTRGYPPRPLERAPVATQPYSHDSRLPHDALRRPDYPTTSRVPPSETARSSYHYPTPSTSRYPPSIPAAPPAPVQSSTMPSRPVHRPVAAPKSNYEYPTTNHVQTSPARSTSKPGYPNQQARMTVSVTSLVNQMNQTKQKRESPLDLSVKTVKNSADSSTTQDDAVDSATSDKHLPIPSVPMASVRPVPGPGPMPTASVRSLSGPGPVPSFESHKVDFAPNFTQCRERNASATSHNYGAAPQPYHPPVRYNGGYEAPKPVPEPPYPAEPRHTYPERNKYQSSIARPEYVPKIDLTRPVIDERRPDNRIRDDRHFIIEERKRPSGPIVSNIPEKMVRYETWAADSRLDRMAQSAREQHELMSRPVYSYSSHQQFEAYQNEQKRAAAASSSYREHHTSHQNHRYPPYPEPPVSRDRIDSYGSYHDRNTVSNRHVIQKIPNHRDVMPHHIDHHSGVPADKRVLSILRNSLETKHTGLEPARPTRPMPDVIVLDDVDDPVIEITDDAETSIKNASNHSRIKYSNLTDNLGQHIKMPKAVDSLPNDSDYQKNESLDTKSSPDNDVARIRTKAELKSLPPSECSMKHDVRSEGSQAKLLPKSQKQHLFNQMRQDNLRFESVIKNEKHDTLMTAVKPEPMNIDEIEKDAVIPIKTENLFESLQPDIQEPCELPEEDNDWASACDSFMEQLKTGVHKKKSPRKHTDTLDRDKESTQPKLENLDTMDEKETKEKTEIEAQINFGDKSTADVVVVKQEPIDDAETLIEPKILAEPEIINADTESPNNKNIINTGVEKVNSKNTTTDDEEIKKNAQSVPDSRLDSDGSNKSKDSLETNTLECSLNKDRMKSKKRLTNKDSSQNEKNNIRTKRLSATRDEKANNKIQKIETKDKTIIKRKYKKEHQDTVDESNRVNLPTKVVISKLDTKSDVLDKGSVCKEVLNKDKNTSHEVVKSTKKNDNKLMSTLDKILSSKKNDIKLDTTKQDVVKSSKKNDCKLEKNDIKPDTTKQDVVKSPKKNENKLETKQDVVKSPKKNDSKLETAKQDLGKLSKKNDKKLDTKPHVVKSLKKDDNEIKNTLKDKIRAKSKDKLEKTVSSSLKTSVKKEIVDEEFKTVIKQEPDSTDDDEPLINRKMLKDKEIKFQVLKDLSEKSAYVKLECFDVDMNKNTRLSIDSLTKDKEGKPTHKKILRRTSRIKGKSQSLGNSRDGIQHNDTSTSDDEDLTVASRLRVRKNTKTEDSKPTVQKSSIKSSPKKQQDSTSSNSTPVKKTGFGDGSDFHPGWEEELYRYKRSLRMPARLIAMPRGRSGGPFVRGPGAMFNRGSTSLPDLDPAPLSPAPSLASAATDDFYARRQDKLNLDSDLESNSSYSAFNRLHYDSEASTSTVLSSSTKPKKKTGSIVDVLIEKCGKRDDNKRKGKDKEKDDKAIPKLIPKSNNPNELLATPSLGLVKNGNKGILSAKKEKLMEGILYLGAFRKETVTAFRNDFINNTDGLIGATEEFAPVVLKTRTRTESRVLKHRATIREVFGEERPASAPPTSCRSEEEKPDENEDDKPIVQIKQEKQAEPEAKPKIKPKKLVKDKVLRKSSTIRDGLRSTMSLKRNDANGRLMRLKKRNSLINNKRMKDFPANKMKKEKTDESTQERPKEGSSGTVEVPTKRRLKRLFGRRKFSSGFDYIRKKKKIVRRDEPGTPNNKIRRPAAKPSPESVHDIQKEMKGWIINKSVGETHLHRAARLGYTDCVAYCLEKLTADPSAKDNAGYTPLHVAAQKGHVRIARLLLQYGANVSAAAQGGIRPLHEASENCHVEVMRLLLSYGADPLLGTYAGQTPEQLCDGPAAQFLRLHIADVQGRPSEPWRYPPPADSIDREELGCDPLSSPPPGSPPPPPDATVEIQCTETPLPPFYSLRNANGQPADGLWCLLQDVTTILQIKSKDSLLKQIHCGSGSPKELLREIRTQEFLERAQCHQLLCAGEKVNIRASKVSLVRVTDKLRQLLKIETVLVS